ncbi:hypothetical protein FGRMN_11147 [Fusarium graminum]|nr:hypothetical protein FGRMN_11147 [Fusarium graminum]
MFFNSLLVLTATAATGLATNLVEGTHEVCASDDAYSINGDTAQILCLLDANPTLVTVTWPAYYGDIYWTKEDCLVDTERQNQCA